jgi:UDPglucose 6-dehydrogenase
MNGYLIPGTNMKICVQGLWHLGLVTSACLASLGFDVIGIDPNSLLIKDLKNKKLPIFEPGLDELISSGLDNGNLKFELSSPSSLNGAGLLWVTFDTPVDDDDKADVVYVEDQIKKILPDLDINTVILISSQMPVLSIRKLEAYAAQHIPHKKFRFASLPENLRLGKAIDVFTNPDRIVVGVRDQETKEFLEKILFRITDKIEWMTVESAEMTKHAINAFLATSVTFANEIASICEMVHADAKEVERGLKTDARIGPKAYLSPGGPFAGGTLARDIEYLSVIGKINYVPTPLISSVRLSNDEHKKWVRRKLVQKFQSMRDVKVALWGLTYKAGTDTLRRSLSVELCDWLIEQNAIIKVYDPMVKELPNQWSSVVMSSNAPDTLKDAQVLIIGTEWPEFKENADQILLAANSDLVIIDANRYLGKSKAPQQFNYISVGISEN